MLLGRLPIIIFISLGYYFFSVISLHINRKGKISWKKKIGKGKRKWEKEEGKRK